MDRVKFYSIEDMSSGYNFNKAIEVIKTLYPKDYDINDIIEFYNIIKIFNKSIINSLEKEIKELCINSQSKLNSIIGKFCKCINNSNIINYLFDVDFNYIEDFFEILDKYKVYKNINDKTFKDILEKNDNYLHIVLYNKELVFYFEKILKESLLNDIKSAETLLDEYEIEHLGNHKQRYFPRCLTKNDKEKVLINYINSDMANLNYLRIIVNLQSTSELIVSDKTRLLAKRKVEEQEKKLFDKSSGVEMSTMIKFQKDVKDAVQFDINGQNWDFTYSADWIEQNKEDYSTLLNNFIYLFEYADRQMRWTMVSKFSFMGIFERTIFMRSKRDYPVSTTFNRLNQLADIQLYGYYEQLQKYGLRIEDLILWFFNEYLPKEFNIENYNINMPSKKSNYLEKCRTLLPEIDSCLKQFNYYVEDGIIDSELIQISSTHMFFKNVKSLLKNKYVYPNGKEYNVITYYLFSDQCMLAYIERFKKKYENFYDLLMNENIKRDEIVRYEQESLNKLIKGGYIYIDNEGFIKIKNKVQTLLLKDINNNDVISYWKLNDKQRYEIDLLVKKELLKFESSLFSKPEQDYLNYNLNKSEFINSLDLRNMYGHGTQSFGNEDVHHSNYIRFLKFFILIIIKINDELCIVDELNKN